MRDAEELHDALESLIALPHLSPSANLSDLGEDLAYLHHSLRESLAKWQRYLDELVSKQRLGRAELGSRSYWVTAEKVLRRFGRSDTVCGTRNCVARQTSRGHRPTKTGAGASGCSLGHDTGDRSSGSVGSSSRNR